MLALALALAVFPALRWLVAADRGLDPTGYTLGVVLVTALSLVPAIVRRSFSVIALPLALSYVVLRFLVVRQELPSFVLVVETLSLLGLAWLVHRLLLVARSFEDPSGASVESTFGSSVDPRDLRLDLARQQFMIACRHERPLSCIVVEADPESLEAQLSQIAPGVNRSFLESYALEWVAKVATETARRSDLTIEGREQKNLVLLCPETSHDNAIRVARKISRALSQQLGLATRLGVATYPEHALTLEDLLRRAASHMQEATCLGDSGQLVFTFEGAPNEVSESIVKPPVTPLASGIPRLSEGLAQPTLRERIGWLSKRTFDLVFVSLFAPLWLPLLALIAVAVKIDSPGGPVFFLQNRVGRWGRRFRMFKFRTMVPSAEELKKELREQSEMAWPDFKMKEDPRITRVGRWLRQTSLDELPQLLNVLLGQMSLVGPRPTSFSDDTYVLWQKARLAVPPGLTGLWQINGRGDSDFEQRARIDISYIERRSFFLDIWILFRTASVVLNRKGGY